MNPSTLPEHSRPGLKSNRRSPGQFIKDEWSLLLLAVILSMTVWDTMRPDVMAGETIVFPIEVPEGHTVLFKRPQPTVSLEIESPKSELREIKEALDASAGKVRLQVGEAPSGGSRPLSNLQDAIAVPFPSKYIKGGKPPSVESLPIQGWVYRLRSAGIRIEQPVFADEGKSLLAARNAEIIEIEFPNDIITLDVPFGSDKQTIAPDPIDLVPYLESQDPYGTVHRVVSLTFNTWRAGADKDEATKTWRKSVRLPARVSCTFKIRQRTSLLIDNALLLLAPNAGDYVFTIDSIPGKVPGKFSFEGSLVGRADTVNQLADPKNKSKWFWGIRLLSPDELPKDEQTVKEMRANIVFVPLPEFQLKENEIRFAPASEDQREFKVSVRRRPEK